MQPACSLLLLAAWLATGAADTVALDSLGEQPRVQELRSLLCGADCSAVWLDPTGVPSVAGAVVDVRACFAIINRTCWDCHKDPPPPAAFPEAVCTHAYFATDPQPVSGQFAFCSGHAAATAEQMSVMAWKRFIGWRSRTCHPAAARMNDGSEWVAVKRGQSLRDAQRLHYYAAGSSGWSGGIEAELRLGTGSYASTLDDGVSMRNKDCQHLVGGPSGTWHRVCGRDAAASDVHPDYHALRRDDASLYAPLGGARDGL